MMTRAGNGLYTGVMTAVSLFNRRDFKLFDSKEGDQVPASKLEAFLSLKPTPLVVVF